MTPNHRIRFTQALVLAAIVTALAVPAVALGGSNTGQRLSPDVFERYAAAHPYGAGVLQTPDVFERYAAAHPYGKGILDTTRAPTNDGRSPDTRDAAFAASSPGNEVPDFVERNDRAHFGHGNSDAPTLVVSDGRSPDTLDAASGPQLIEVARPGSFDWSDAGIGAVTGAATIALLASSILLLTHRRNRIQAT